MPLRHLLINHFRKFFIPIFWEIQKSIIFFSHKKFINQCLEHPLTFPLFINLTFGFHGFPSLICYMRLFEILINAGLWVVTIKCLEIIVGLCMFFTLSLSTLTYVGVCISTNQFNKWSNGKSLGVQLAYIFCCLQ